MVQNAIEGVEDLEQRVQEVLCGTLSVTIGQPTATRHPFNERTVAMIGEVLDAHHKVMKKLVEEKQSAFEALAPTKGTREEAMESSKALAETTSEAFDKAKMAVAEHVSKTQGAALDLEAARLDQATGNKELNAIAAKKASLEAVQGTCLMPLLDGTAPEEDRSQKIAHVMEAGKTFSFDPSLMQAVVQVLEKNIADRTGFDATCTEQIQAAFASSSQQFDDQLASGAPAQAERLAAVQQAEADKEAAAATQVELVEHQVAAKVAKEAAAEAAKIAKKSLADFMPELKDAGDTLDQMNSDLDEFATGALAAYNELKDWKEGDFDPPPVTTGASFYETIDGMDCDRAVIDACRTAVAGQGDGRVSIEDAKQVFEKIADGGRETQKERWTLRYCMQKFKWTDAAHDWIVEELKKVVQEDIHGSPSKKAKTEGGAYYEAVDGFNCDRGIVDACRDAVAGQGDGRISRDDAEKVWAKAKDGNKVTDAEKWTLRYCFSSFNWTRAGHDWLLEQCEQEEA